MTLIRFPRLSCVNALIVDLYICIGDKISNIQTKLFNLWINFRYPYAATFDTENPIEYKAVIDWIYQNVPDYKKQIWCHISNQTITITGTGVIIQTNFTGEVRFKNQEYCVAFILRFKV